MEIHNPEVKISIEVTLKELRVIEYALRNVEDEEYKNDASGMAVDILTIMKGNGIEMIQDKPFVPVFAEIDKEKVDILQ